MKARTGIVVVIALVAAWPGQTLAVSAAKAGEEAKANAVEQDVTQGALRIVTKEGGVVECPLKHTDVQATISGFIARVKVTQTFANPLDEKIEAVYVFPLPHKAAVDDMTMVVGERRIVGLIKRRAEAKQIYEAALQQGLTAALLEQERPNIFTQSVGNIPPRQEVRIEISYVDVLEYDMGIYEFHFPMVVGPRYIPGSPTSKIAPVPPELKGKVGELDKTKVPEGKDQPKGTGWAPDTTRVPDASRITPPVLKPEFRTGHDVSLSVRLEAGVPIQDLKVANHKAALERDGKCKAAIALTPEDNIPNKDFVLRYGVVGKKPEMAVLCHVSEMGHGYFMLMVQPQEDERLKQSPPREIVFLVDVSGSMSGAPIAKVRETMSKLLKLCRPQDTLQVITFASSSAELFPRAVPATPESIQKALGFTNAVDAGGGTEMLKGIRLALNAPLDPERLRIVIMLTDGYIGNEAEIIAEVGRGCGDRIRFWCIGIGAAPNRFLVDGVGRQGGGASKVLGLQDDPEPMAIEVMNRIQRAQLANVQIDWADANVWETYPAKIPELWAGRPIILFGRFEGANQPTQVLIKGEVEGKPTSWALPVRFPVVAPENGVLSRVWARNKIEDLMQQTFYQGSPAVEEEVTQIALSFRLMSQYTSFVAVDESQAKTMTEPARPPRRMLVPLPIPEGTRFEGFFDDRAVFGFAKSGTASRVHLARTRSDTMQKMIVSGGGTLSAPMPMYRGTLPPSPSPAAPPRIVVRAAQGQPGVASGRSGSIEINGRRYGASFMDAYGHGYKAASPASLPAKKTLAHNYVRSIEREEELGAEDLPAGWDLARRAMVGQAMSARKLALKALEEGEGLRKKGTLAALAAARARYAWAALLDAACEGMGYGTERPGAALAAIEEVDKELLKARAEQVPALEKKLDAILRDKSLSEALEIVSNAAGIPVKLIPGSIEDAAALTGHKEPRVVYLDLRRATVAQALNWVLVPERMSWWVSQGEVTVGTSRRSGIDSAWVYDVSFLALPPAKETEALKSDPEREAAVTKALGQFLGVTRSALSLKEDTALWYAPGQLLVFGEANAHGAAAKLFADLASPDAKLEGEAAELHKVTRERAKEQQAAEAKHLAAVAKSEVLGTLQGSLWPLLAGAASGQVDLEALTQLQVAWRSPVMGELLKGGSVQALWGLWTVSESARALPKEAELAALARTARAMSRGAADEALAALEKSPGDVGAFLEATYAALAFRDDAPLVSRARRALVASRDKQAQFAAAQKVVDALLAPAAEIDRTGLLELVSKSPEQIVGDDLVVWTALACRRAGGEAWRAFRANARDLLGRQPLDGSVVVLVNRLSNPASPLVAGTR